MMGKALIILIAAVIAALLIDANSNFFGGIGTPRGGPIACYNDSDCAPTTTRYCDANGSACVSTTIYRCVNPGQNDSFCQPAGSGGGCGPVCAYGCSDGTCLPQPNGPDLIAENLTREVRGDTLVLTPIIRNIGTADAPSTITQVQLLSSGSVWLLNTSGVPAGQSVAAESMTFAAAGGSSYTFRTTADTFNRVAETDEGNNGLVTTVQT